MFVYRKMTCDDSTLVFALKLDDGCFSVRTSTVLHVLSQFTDTEEASAVVVGVALVPYIQKRVLCALATIILGSLQYRSVKISKASILHAGY